SFIIGVLFYSVVSLAIILFASPLFSVLGFEYATLISLAISIHLLIYSSEKSTTPAKGNFRETLKKIYPAAVLFTSIPFFIGIIHGLVIDQCDLLLGIAMYIQVVFPTTILAVLFGIHFGWMKEKPTTRRLWVSAFWMVTFIISLLPGYFYPQIFTYGWQYGFFPGIVWDAAMELQPAYWWSRLLVLLFAVGFLTDDYHLIKAGAKTWREKVKARQENFWHSSVFFINAAIFICLVLLSALGITRSHDYITRELTKTIDVKSSVIIHCTDSTFTKDELTLLQYKCSLYCDSIRSFFHIKDKRLTHLYIYPSNDLMKKFVGTASASIAKPWMNELHIAKENLGSLKHELVHTLLAPHGNFPFDISWSTGLTEGAAVAVEDNYDGIRDCDDYSARILQLGLAKGVKEVMSFSGFAAQASGKSYTLAGSFSKYLIKQYGSEKFLSLYTTRDYDGIYNKPVEVLEREWITSLRLLQTPMNKYDSLRVRFYFDRTSIINEPCLRRIGRMMKEASELYEQGLYNESGDIYHDVLKEDSDNLGALRGATLSMIQINDASAALRTISQAQGSNTYALHTFKGDCMILSGSDTTSAMKEWDESMSLELSAGSVLTAYLRYHYLSKLDSSILNRTLVALYSPKLTPSDIINTVVMSQPDTSSLYQRIGYDILLYRLCREAGKINDALKYANDAIKTFEIIGTLNDRPSQIVKKAFEDFIRTARPAMKGLS
ncbi:MAG TPA: hypothetical protein VIX80_10790, partial [Candidatus Kapabacteria bacterium]